jgi:uncharacterized protein (TIGR02246 family)
VLASLLAGCTSAQTTNGAAIVDTVKAGLADAFVRHDAAALAGLFAEDGVVIAPDGTLLEGRSAIQKALTAMLPGVRGYSITSRRTEVDGGIAYDQETFQVTLATDGAAERTITGHQLVVLRRAPDGGWRIVESGAWSAPPQPMDDMPGMTP